MSINKRTFRLNSLLREVISEVIRSDVKNPNIHELLTVTEVDISRDLHSAKVYISVIGPQSEKDKTLKALQSASGYVGVTAAKKVTLRYFPQLTFKLDESVEKHMQIDELLNKINIDKNPQ
ncbi:MAG: Ribosome-binding factor A [Chlamydiae bacterium]|nr:Ribosome-binding factor A [Chlamydiota bacterium]